MRFGLRSTEPAIEIWTKRLQHEPNQLVTKKKPISLAMKLKNKKWVVSRQGTGELIKKKEKKLMWWLTIRQRADAERVDSTLR